MPGKVESIDRKTWQWGQNYYHIFQRTEMMMKRMGHQKKAQKELKELARTPGEYEVTEAPTKLSFGFCTMETIW